MASFENGLGADQDIEIEIDQAAIAHLLAANPDFIRRISMLVRDDIIKQSRKMGNLFDQQAQRTPPPTTAPSVKRRLN